MDDGKTWVFEGMGMSVSIFIPPSGDGRITSKTAYERQSIDVPRASLYSFAKWMIEQTDPGPKTGADKDGGT